MADKIIEGIWDCPYCDATAIGGLHKHCPCCGHPQDKGTKFRVGEEKRYLTDEERSKVGKGPDWACEYCDSLNNAQFKFCSSCGAPRDGENKDYFQLREEEKQKAEQEQRQTFEPKKPRKIRFVLLAALLAVVLLGIGMCSAKDYSGVISDKSWNRDVEVEEYTTVEESDWNIPQGGRLLHSETEIRSYRQVFDHYETRTREVPYQVEDGFDTTYTDNGDGTFTEHSTPKYRTEYRTEEYQEEIYRDEPVYDTKYYYEIDKWVPGRVVSTSGADDAPYWGELNLSDNEREGRKTEAYVLKISVEKKKGKTVTYDYETSFDVWNGYKVGSKVDIVIKLGEIQEIK